MSIIRDLVNEASDDRWTTSSSAIGKGVVILNDQLAAEQSYSRNVSRVSAASNGITNKEIYINRPGDNMNSIPCDDIKIESDHHRLKRRLRDFGLMEINVKGDGNCQFRALSYQLYGTEDKYQLIRAEICKYMEFNSNLYKDFIVSDEEEEYNSEGSNGEDKGWKEYIKNMKLDYEWGDHLTLQAFANLYHKSLHLITSYHTNEFIQINPQNNTHGESQVILLGFWAEVHYNPVVSIDDSIYK